ncbi:MAG: dihydroneopterin aldolase [Oligoflexales bacterium]|nr:dihydroneopterin aldolase [Oligoflexales bacterium]
MVLEILDYPVFMRLGIFPEEKKTGQDVLISIRAKLTERDFALLRDEISSTLDYGKLMHAAEEILEGRSFNLIESVLAHFADELLIRYADIASLELTLEKPNLPNGLGRGSRVRVSYSKTRVNVSGKEELGRTSQVFPLGS